MHPAAAYHVRLGGAVASQPIPGQSHESYTRLSSSARKVSEVAAIRR
jgi:hypothetical protein